MTVLLQNHLLDGEAKKVGNPVWNTVRYMIARIQYGGRITDKFDQLLMDSYAEKFFNQVRYAFCICAMVHQLVCSQCSHAVTHECCKQGALAPAFVLWQDVRADGLGFRVPHPLNELDTFRKAAEAFPAQEKPEVFGLHANADLTCRSLQVTIH